MKLKAFLLRSAAKSTCLRVGCLLLVGSIVVACVDEIDLGQADDLSEGIVLRGQMLVEDDTTSVVINLERLYQFSSNLAEQVVSADVVLENTLGESLEMPYRDGAYRLTIEDSNPVMTIRPGIAYRVVIDVTENESYITAYDTLQAGLAPEDLTHEFVEVDGFTPAGTPTTIPSVQYAVTTPVRYPDGRPARLLYRLQTVFAVSDRRLGDGRLTFLSKTCYVSQGRANGDVVLLDGSSSANDRIEGFPVLTVPLNAFYAEANYVTAYQLTISQPAFVYFSQVAQIADQSRSIFGNPPGPVAGNVNRLDGSTGNVFGFFYTATRHAVREGLTAAEAGNPGFYCPTRAPASPNSPPSTCDDCLRFANSRLTPPPFWDL